MDKDEFESKLIIEVENHPCIYDQTNVVYKNRNMKADSWTKIAAIVGKPVLECQRKWTNLRDTFSRLFKIEQRIPSGSKATSAPKWKHYNNLLYLCEYTQIPSTMSNYSNTIEPQMKKTKNDSSDLFDELIEIDENYIEEEITLQVPKPPTSKPPPPTPTPLTPTKKIGVMEILENIFSRQYQI